MQRRISKHSQPSQILFKEHWRLLKGGGQYLEYTEDRWGNELLEPTKLEDIKPGQQYYMQSIWKPAEFFPTTFDPKVSWDSIKELHRTGRIWQLTQEKKDMPTSLISETGSESSDGIEQ